MHRIAQLNVTRLGRSTRIWIRVAVIFVMGLAATAIPLFGSGTGSVAFAHNSSGYSHDSTNGATHSDWMANIPNGLRVSELSIPGTHDSGAYEFGGDIVFTQTMNISNQLNAGIRAMDIRLKIDDGELKVYHGIAAQGLKFDTDVLATVTSFLAAHPSETVLMRIKDEDAPPQEDGFDGLVNQTLNAYSSYVYQGSSDNPTLGEIRGKIVVLQNFSSSVDFGIPWSSLSIQDEFALSTNWDLSWKWGKVKDHFTTANNNANYLTVHVNFTSAANGGFPYFFASGHSSPQTGAPRLLTGYTRGVINTCDDYPDKCIDEFPSVNCFAGTCSVAFEGINILAMNYLNAGNVRRAGIVMSDFPGHGLIEAIINLNPWNWPPVADAGGPYVGDEGSVITFNAAGSSDQDGDTLSYRWDFDNDGTWDTPSSNSPTASHTWADDFTGTVAVEVSDSYHTSTATAPVTVLNVAPVVTIAHVTDETGAEVGTGARLVLTSVPIGLQGFFTDVGILDTHTASIDWGDGTTDHLGATTGAVATHHTYLLPGVYMLTLSVTDDDNGIGKATTSVTVVDASSALTSIVQDLVDLQPDPGLSPAAKRALAKAQSELAGNDDGRARNGAIALLDKGNRNAAVGAIARSIQYMQDVEALTGMDMSDTMSLLTLTAKSVAVEAVQKADNGAGNTNQQNKVADAWAHIAEGNNLLAAHYYVESVDRYQKAVRIAQAFPIGA